jgi:hypothetical protein
MADTHGKAQILAQLRVASEAGDAIAVYAETDDSDTYEVGFVEACDSNQVILQCITSKGEPDGRRIIRMEDVVRVESASTYIRKVQLLYQYRDTVFEKDFRAAPEGTSIADRLRHAMESHTIVHVTDITDSGPRGFVKEVGEDYVMITQIGRTGEPDGHTTMMLENIHKVHIGRRQDQVYEFLYRYNVELKRLLEH